MTQLIIIGGILLIRLLIVAHKPEPENAYSYKMNGKEYLISSEEYYVYILGLSEEKILSPDIISKAFFKKLNATASRRLSGETVYLNIKELRAAKEYLMDAYMYQSALN